MSNIFDIARAAGVSKTTVSRVMNNQSGVNENTRKKVLDAIQKLNYTPNLTARSLVTRKTGVIGVIYNELNASIYLELANMLEKYAKDHDYNVIFCSSNDNYDSKVKYMNYLTSGATDGVILFGSDMGDKELVQKIKATKFPFVIIENYFGDIDINNIMIDNVNGARKAVDYLVSLGHSRIAHVTGNVNHKASADRLLGYTQSLNENKIKYNPDYVIYTDAGKNSGDYAFEKLINLDCPPTAIFTFNDIQGYEAIQKANELGIRVPQDISIIGFDDISAILNFIPSSVLLTSMKQPMEQVAKTAIDLIISNIENENEKPRLYTFDTTLRLGGSCSKLEAEPY